MSALFALLLQAAATPAAPAAPSCPVLVRAPAALAAWDAAPAAQPTIGHPAAVTLAPATTVSFALAPDRAPTADTFAGTFPLTIAAAGTYSIALSGAAWIDLVDAQHHGVRSAAHTMGPACTGIRKIVDFALTPGRYTLQLSGAKAAAIRVLVVGP